MQTALTRLSTGLRINSGSDDPAGLIASEALRSEITSLTKSISNTRRASQIISTADSALGQVSNLLNDIRGLVVEAANTAGMSREEVAANQLQVDSSLAAINRIAKTTTFQGRKLLDGSLDFITSPGAGAANTRNLQVGRAALGTTGSVDVAINVTAAATQAALDVEGFREAANAVAGVKAQGAIEIQLVSAAAQSTTGTITTGGSGGQFTLTAKPGGAYSEAALNGYSVIIATNGASSSIAVNNVAQTVTVTLRMNQTFASIATALAAHADIAFASTGMQTVVAGDQNLAAGSFGGGSAAINDSGTINIEAAETGADFNGTVTFAQVNGTSPPTASFSGGVLTVTVDDTGWISMQSIVDAINELDDFTATRTGGLTTFNAAAPALTVTETDLTGGVTELLAGAQADSVFELAGSRGSEVFEISAGTSIQQLVAQINLVSDATGVQATANGSQLQLRSTDYGSGSAVALRVLSEGAGGNFGSGGRSAGVDTVATVNGRTVNGAGNRISLTSTTLNLAADMEVGFTGSANFTISGGGTQFQLGPAVVGNQQARLGIGGVNSARLGGAAGRLFELGAGEAASLASDPTRAVGIVDEAINQVTALRGRLGAFQSTSLKNNFASLSDAVANLQEAESTIRGADFAAESAALTRAQILVQSGINVLALANQNPQNVLSLLR